jgi:hypothetical protein
VLLLMPVMGKIREDQMFDRRPLSDLKGGLDMLMGIAYFVSDAHDVARRFSPGGWTRNSGR